MFLVPERYWESLTRDLLVDPRDCELKIKAFTVRPHPHNCVVALFAQHTFQG